MLKPWMYASSQWVLGGRINGVGGGGAYIWGVGVCIISGINNMFHKDRIKGI